MDAQALSLCNLDSLPQLVLNSKTDKRLVGTANIHVTPNGIRIELFEQIPTFERGVSNALCVVNFFLLRSGGFY